VAAANGETGGETEERRRGSWREGSAEGKATKGYL